MVIDKTNGTIANWKSLTLYVDGGCEPKNPGGVATSGWAIFDSENQTLLVEQGTVVQDGGPKATNNYGEYTALILALNWLESQKWQGELNILADSKLLVEQVLGRWQVKALHLQPLRAKIWASLETLGLVIIDSYNPLPPEGKKACRLTWISRELNEYANNLCRAAYKLYVANR